MKRLTQKEVEALPVGTPVYVKWSGGNGPFWYVIREDRYGNRTINSENRGQSVNVQYVKGSYVGLKAPSTTVEVEDDQG